MDNNQIPNKIDLDGKREFIVKQIDHNNKRGRILWYLLLSSAFAIGLPLYTKYISLELGLPATLPFIMTLIPPMVMNKIHERNLKNSLNGITKGEETARDFRVKMQEKGYGKTPWISIVSFFAYSILYLILEYMSHGSVRMHCPIINMIEMGAIGMVAARSVQELDNNYQIRKSLK